MTCGAHIPFLWLKVFGNCLICFKTLKMQPFLTQKSQFLTPTKTHSWSTSDLCVRCYLPSCLCPFPSPGRQWGVRDLAPHCQLCPARGHGPVRGVRRAQGPARCPVVRVRPPAQGSVRSGHGHVLTPHSTVGSSQPRPRVRAQLGGHQSRCLLTSMFLSLRLSPPSHSLKINGKRSWGED